MSTQHFNSIEDKQNLMKSLIPDPQKMFIKTEKEQRPPKSTILEKNEISKTLGGPRLEKLI